MPWRHSFCVLSTNFWDIALGRSVKRSLEGKLLQGRAKRFGARHDCPQIMKIPIKEGHELLGVRKGFTGIGESPTPSRAGHEGGRTAERERKRQFPGQKAELSRLRVGGDSRGAKRSDGSLKDASSSEEGAGYDLPDVEWVETQAFVEFFRAGVGLRPGGELAKLLLDNGPGPIFNGAAHNSTVAPKLGGESEPSV